MLTVTLSVMWQCRLSQAFTVPFINDHSCQYKIVHIHYEFKVIVGL